MKNLRKYFSHKKLSSKYNDKNTLAFSQSNSKFLKSTIVKNLISNIIADNKIGILKLLNYFENNIDYLKKKDNNYEIEQEFIIISRLYISSIKNLNISSDPFGYEIIRENISRTISFRDNFDYDVSQVYLFSSKIEAFDLLFRFLDKDSFGVLTGNSVDLEFKEIVDSKGFPVFYFEKDFYDFERNFCRLKNVFFRNRDRIKVLYFSNPDFLSGTILGRKDILRILEFAFENNLLIIVDEQFQNTITSRQHSFSSFNECLIKSENTEMKNNLEIISLYSNEGSIFKETEFTGSFLNFFNIDKKLEKEFFKLCQLNQCAYTLGQIALDIHFCFHQIKYNCKNSMRLLFDYEYSKNKNYLESNYQLFCEKFRNNKFLEIIDSYCGYYFISKLKYSNDVMEKKFGDKNFDEEISKIINKNCGFKTLYGSKMKLNGYIVFDKRHCYDEFNLSALEKTLILINS